MSRIEIVHAEAIDFLRTLPDASVDALVTDPPSGISFMGADWDSHTSYDPKTNTGRDAVRFMSALNLEDWEVGFVAFIADVMWECWRVLKPGAHGLVWALPRTSDLTAMGLRLARFQIRDSVHHMFGSGFPKSMDISKAIDKAAGAEREVVGTQKLTGTAVTLSGGNYGGGGNNSKPRDEIQITKSATPDAQRWEGWGTALKPGHEVWWLVRKPLSGTVAQNVQEHGVGGIHIDACRVTTDETPEQIYNGQCGPIGGANGIYSGGGDCPEVTGHSGGRWPPNVLLTHSAGCERVGTKSVKGISGGRSSGDNAFGQDSGWNSHENRPTAITRQMDKDGNERVDVYECVQGCPVGELARQSGQLMSGSRKAGSHELMGYNGASESPLPALSGSSGTAARFYPNFEQDEDTEWDCVEDCPVKEVGEQSGGAGSHGGGTRGEEVAATSWSLGDRSGSKIKSNWGEGTAARFYPQFHYFPKPSRSEREAGLESLDQGDDAILNHHPTVKSIALMKWLVQLIAPEGGLVLDPFTGSGTTAVACAHLNMRFVGSEMDEKYVEIARTRVGHADPSIEMEYKEDGKIKESPKVGQLKLW